MKQRLMAGFALSLGAAVCAACSGGGTSSAPIGVPTAMPSGNAPPASLAAITPMPGINAPPPAAYTPDPSATVAVTTPAPAVASSASPGALSSGDPTIAGPSTADYAALAALSATPVPSTALVAGTISRFTASGFGLVLQPLFALDTTASYAVQQSAAGAFGREILVTVSGSTDDEIPGGFATLRTGESVAVAANIASGGLTALLVGPWAGGAAGMSSAVPRSASPRTASAATIGNRRRDDPSDSGNSPVAPFTLSSGLRYPNVVATGATFTRPAMHCYFATVTTQVTMTASAGVNFPMHLHNVAGPGQYIEGVKQYLKIQIENASNGGKTLSGGYFGLLAVAVRLTPSGEPGCSPPSGGLQTPMGGAALGIALGTDSSFSGLPGTGGALVASQTPGQTAQASLVLPGGAGIFVSAKPSMALGIEGNEFVVKNATITNAEPSTIELDLDPDAGPDTSHRVTPQAAVSNHLPLSNLLSLPISFASDGEMQNDYTGSGVLVLSVAVSATGAPNSTLLIPLDPGGSFLSEASTQPNMPSLTLQPDSGQAVIVGR